MGPKPVVPIIPNTNEDSVINYNLEGIITMNFQEKQKRDRIGIIFRMAKQAGWSKR